MKVDVVVVVAVDVTAFPAVIPGDAPAPASPLASELIDAILSSRRTVIYFNFVYDDERGDDESEKQNKTRRKYCTVPVPTYQQVTRQRYKRDERMSSKTHFGPRKADPWPLSAIQQTTKH